MRERLSVAIVLGAVGCSLTTSFSGLSDGTREPDAGTLPTPGDAAVDAAVDAEAGPDPLDEGLVGFWRFDEPSGIPVLDSSGRENTGAIVNGAVRVPGKVGSALRFDGVDDHVSVAQNASFATTTAMSTTFWIKADASSVSGTPRVVTLASVWNVKLNSGSPQLTLGSAYAASSAKLVANEWHHVAVVFSTGVVTIYVDGLARTIATNTFTGTEVIGSAGDGFYIGAMDSRTSFLGGELDEVRLYGRALTAAEVAALAR